MITDSSNNVQLCDEIIQQFDASIDQFYHAHDFLKGCIVTKNRHGIEESFPLLTISIAGILNQNIHSIYELSEIASLIKKQCKQITGSNFLLQVSGTETNMKF
ncbi:hypothetical protein [Bacillus sp. FJAT-22090]|uniref:hypothetical protein n=1 Tax=Bacillus sp. FJAT-22090 TaxID=1581038 RepID=UPI001C93145B|nr:hypothetical protein [Bacillus sp. FJAT-22090]